MSLTDCFYPLVGFMAKTASGFFPGYHLTGIAAKGARVNTVGGDLFSYLAGRAISVSPASRHPHTAVNLLHHGFPICRLLFAPSEGFDGSARQRGTRPLPGHCVLSTPWPPCRRE